MNYINQLQTSNADLAHEAATRAQRIQEFREHLSSPKFNHIAEDGSRTDWISTADVRYWLLYISSSVEQ